MTLTLPAPQGDLWAPVGLSPGLARHLGGDGALQRLNYQPTRTLTESAVELEQLWSEARLGMAGRWLTPGIVEGLATGLADQTLEPGGFTLSAGRAIAPGGQDVQVLRALSFRLDDLPQVTGGLAPAPRGLVVPVLEPLVVEAEQLPQDAARLDAFSGSAPPDAATAPYLDFVLQDAARLAWMVLDPALGGGDAARAANMAAEALRRADALPGPGVPLVLFFVAPDGTIRWQHRAAVARRGGVLRRPERKPLARLRQSRVEGLIEEVTLLSRAGWDGSDARSVLRHLPPAGLLPRKAWTGQPFFPPAWRVAQAPIPASQLDAALEGAAALAPYDLDVAEDTVKWLVPVPDRFYSADLLQPVTDPDFAEVTGLLQGAVADARRLREAYRAQAPVVQGMLDAATISDFTLAEDDPVADEETLPTLDPAEPVDHAAEAGALLAEVSGGLSATLFLADQRAMVDPAQRAAAIAAGTPFGLTPFVRTMRALIDAGNDQIDFAFNRVQAEIYRVRQITLDNEEATKLATFPTLAGLAKGNNSYALAEGLRAHFAAQKAADAPAPGAPVAGRASAPASVGLARFAATGIPAITADRPLSLRTGLTAFSTAGTAPVAAAALFGDRGALAVSPVAGGVAGAVVATGAFSGFSSSAATLTFGSLVGTAAVDRPSLPLVKDLVDSTRAGLVDDVILSDAVAKKTGILRASPIPGEIRDVRTTTIADRLKTSAALTAKSSAVRIKADVLRQVQGLGISLAGLEGPLTSGQDRVLLPRPEIEREVASLRATLNADQQAQLDAAMQGRRSRVQDTGDAAEWEIFTFPAATMEAAGAVAPIARLALNLRRLNAPVTMPLLPALTLAKALDPDPDGASGDDESAWLAAAINTLEGAIAILRLVEGRLDAILAALEGVEAQIARAAGILGRWSQALTLADQDLDEARHDLRVAESLIDEETARLAALRTERQRILAEEVRFVAFCRPRVLPAHRRGDTLGLSLPGAIEDPLPASLARDVALPDDLQAMMEALREMPLAWFSANPELAAEFTAPKFLGEIYAGLSSRASARMERLVAIQKAVPPVPQVIGAAAIGRVQVARVSTAYRGLAIELLARRRVIDLVAFDRASWADRRRRALADLSLNDLIESGSQPRVARLAAQEIETIERVLNALGQQARQVPPAIRLLWAQALSAYDDVASLSRLNRLPAWERVEFGLRARLERLNGWLFGRIEAGVPEAGALMTDIVRVALLVAAHAPVADIVAARLAVDQTVSKGSGVDLTIRRGNPRIGMQVSFASAAGVQARGIVRDLAGSRARVEIVHVAQPLLDLTTLHQVAVFAPQSVARVAR